MFTIRTTKPQSGNKCYNTVSNGGWSLCIIGKPTDPGCNVLANCVGYACGRFNEIYNEITGFHGMKYKELNCNAEDFINRGKSIGLQVSNIPKLGGIMVWKYGNIGNGNDGAGHVAIVEKILNKDKNGIPTSIFLSESGYNAAYFWNSTRNNENKNWGESAKYEYIGCLINPAVKEITPNVPRDKSVNQIEVKIKNLRVRTSPGLNEEILGFANIGYYNYYKTEIKDNYTWYKIADKEWIASNNDWTTVLPKEDKITLKYKVGDVMILNGYLYRDAKGNGKGAKRTNFKCTITKTCDTPGTVKPYNVNNGLGWVSENDLTPFNNTLQVGDYVKIIGTGNGSADGTSNTAYGIGYKRKILKIYYGYKYPYQVGNSKNTIGFYQKNALEKL